MRIPSTVVPTDVGSLAAFIRVDGEDVQGVIVATDKQQKVTVHATLGLAQMEELYLGLQAMLNELRSSPVMG